MKTSKTTSKAERTSKNSGVVKSKQVIINSYSPDEEEIRERALEIYNQRIERGEQGTPENDWFEAENFLRETIV